jgi:hypothetical protein
MRTMYLEHQDSSRRPIPLTEIRRDASIQPRTRLNNETVAAYAELIREGEVSFPPVIVFYDGSDYLLADGFHRAAAVEEAGETMVFAEIRSGTREDAIRYACGANGTHGLPLTNKDKNQVVNRMLDAEQGKPAEQRLSERDIAKHCGVSQGFVNKIKQTRQRQSDHGDRPDHRDHHPARLPDAGWTSGTDSMMEHGNGMPGDVPTAAQASAADIIDTIVVKVMGYLSQLTGVSASLVEKHFQQAVTEIQCQIRSLSNLRQDDGV